VENGASSFAGAASKPLHVEIGCNGGHVTLQWAKRDPGGLYVGLDWKYKQIYRAADKAKRAGIQNVIFLRFHAERIGFVFAPGEIDHLYLYFPDPWPKKSQWKNRFVTPETLRALGAVVRPGGTFHIKTDHDGYFEWMERAIAEVPDLWRVVDRTTDLHAGVAEPGKLEIPDVTLFEKLFIKDGINIKSVKLERAR
jgi:tRNA (guanine-N7-)-methyltransferase